MTSTATITNHKIHLVSRPKGEPTLENFKLISAPLPELADGEILVRNHYLSLDPYMRGRMNDGKNYAQPQALDAVMVGGTVGEVVASKGSHFAVGDKIVAMGGWQEYTVLAVGSSSHGNGLARKIGSTAIPLSAYLGAVGMPGVTAWYGLTNIIGIKAGETLVVSAASGAVGSAVGQLAKSRGARAVGIAGGADKCAYVVNELGFDACVDYKAHADVGALTNALKQACPNGIDGYFENVGGNCLNAVLANGNAFARVAMCGMISGYNGEPIPLAYPQLFLMQRMKLEGFIVSEHMEVWPQALSELGAMVASGKLKYRESIAPNLASAPEAFLGLLKGRNFGKQIVKLV
jgi:NADPH-dependent curcumin reductase